MKKLITTILAAVIINTSISWGTDSAYWNGSTDGNWSTGANWSKNNTGPWTTGTGPVNNDQVLFLYPSGSFLNSTNDLANLTVRNTTGNYGGWSLVLDGNKSISISGNTLNIGNGVGGEIYMSGANHNISANLNLVDNVNYNNFTTFIGTQTISGVISGTRGAGGPDEVTFRAVSDSDRIILSNTNTYDVFSTIIDRGIVQVTSLRNADQASSLGKAPLTGGRIRAGVLDWNATIDYVGTGDSTDRKIRIGDYDQAGFTGSVSLLNNGSGALVWTAATLNDYQNFGGNTLANRVLTLGGTNADNNEIRSIITNNKGADNGTSFSDTVGTIGIAKTGTGLWILSGNNTYTGSTTVSGGTLLINGSLLSTNTTVSTGATLGGSGVLQAVTLQGGTLAPGNSPGLLTMASLDASNGFLNFELGAPTTRGVSYDAINVQNLLELGSNTAWTFSAYNNYAFQLNDSYDLFNWGTLDVSAFDSNTLLAALPDLNTASTNLAWDVSNFTTDGTVNVIPEPSVASLMMLGGAALSLFALRKIKNL